VHFSVTSLDPRLSARLEPRASAPHARLRAMRTLPEAGVPVGVMVAPVIPWINDHALEAVLEAAHAAGADSAGYVLLRLPHEVAPLFRDWLQAHHPDRAVHVMSTVQQLRGGKDYDSAFGKRMRGEGVLPTCWRGASRWRTNAWAMPNACALRWTAAASSGRCRRARHRRRASCFEAGIGDWQARATLSPLAGFSPFPTPGRTTPAPTGTGSSWWR
jgi:DNA repair photolyase